jgi:hypothetical protein
MPYSQKYSLVSFLQPISIGAEFNMADWPLHVTLADVFAIDMDSTKIEAKLAELVSYQLPVYTCAREDATLGTTEVVLLDKTEELVNLHMSLVDLLERNGAVFNSPEFTREGFLPHCTIQKSERLHAGDEVKIDTIALINMFPHEDWQQRQVINIFSFHPSHKE